MIKFVVIFVVFFLLSSNLFAQVEEICAESGANPSLDSPFAHVPYIYGKVELKGVDPAAKPAKVTVSLTDGQESAQRWTIGNSGNYCFKRKSSGNGTLTVEINGLEVARRSLSSFASPQQREDFEIFSNSTPKSPPPGVISAKFIHPVNPKTVELYKKTNEAD